MKNQRRHELQTNQLADSLGKTINTTKPFLKWIGMGVIAVGLAAASIGIIAHRQNVTSGNAWSDYMKAIASPDRQLALQDVASVYPSSAAAVWAELAKADLNLGQGCQSIYQNRDEAEKSLNQAIDGYQDVLNRSPADAFIVQRAQFGLGQAFETLGRLKEARDAYDQVIQRGETTALAILAKDHLDLLKDDEMQAFYDWFVAQKSISDASGTGLPNMPGDLRDLPDFPDLSVPGASNPPSPRPGVTPSESSQPPSESKSPTNPDTAPPVTNPAGGEPATGDKTPAEDKSAPEKAAPQPPATEGEGTSEGSGAPPAPPPPPANPPPAEPK